MMKKLVKIKERNPFRVPEGYFEEVNRKIISATSGTGKTESRPVHAFRFRPYLLAAASVAGFIVLSYAAIKFIVPHRIEKQASEVTNEVYFSPYFNDLDIYSLEENASTLAIPEYGPDVSKAEIIEYLVLENIEISEIYEQL